MSLLSHYILSHYEKKNISAQFINIKQTNIE